MKTQPQQWDGSVITERGLYSDIPIETYHSNPFLCDGPSISSSSLKDFIERPSKYWAYSPYNVNRFDKEAKPHFDFGKAAHYLILEGNEADGEFAKYFAIRPDTYVNDKGEDKKWIMSANACKKWVEDQGGKAILSSDDMKAIYCMRDRLLERHEVQAGILSGLVETSMLVKHGKIWLRSRPDVIPASSGDFVDLKKTGFASYSDLERNIYKFGYHIQAAICRMNYRALYGDDVPFSYALVFCEDKAPFDNWIYQLDDTALDMGEQMARTALKYFEKCIDRWEWPTAEGFNPIISNIGIPAWAKAQSETQLAYMKEELRA